MTTGSQTNIPSAQAGSWRQWRVGTWSMGLALLATGGSLLVSSQEGQQAFLPLSVWWPALFILLGIEILLYLAVQRRSAPFLKFDLLSILMLGMIGTVGLVLTGLQQTGVLREIQRTWQAEERLLEVPALHAPVTADVKKIVVRTEQMGYWPITAEPGAERAVHLAGTVRNESMPGEKDPEWLSSLFRVEKMGDTLYVWIRTPPRKTGFDRSPSGYEVIAVLPKDVPVEFHCYQNNLEIADKPGNWSIVSGR